MARFRLDSHRSGTVAIYGSVALVRKQVNGPYRSVRRAQRTAATRGAIRQAARITVHRTKIRGYDDAAGGGTRAGADERTLYHALPTKADLFHYVVGAAIVGDDALGPTAQRPEFRSASVLDALLGRVILSLARSMA